MENSNFRNVETEIHLLLNQVAEYFDGKSKIGRYRHWLFIASLCLIFNLPALGGAIFGLPIIHFGIGNMIFSYAALFLVPAFFWLFVSIHKKHIELDAFDCFSLALLSLLFVNFIFEFQNNHFHSQNLVISAFLLVGLFFSIKKIMMKVPMPYEYVQALVIRFLVIFLLLFLVLGSYVLNFGISLESRFFKGYTELAFVAVFGAHLIITRLIQISPKLSDGRLYEYIFSLLVFLLVIGTNKGQGPALLLLFVLTIGAMRFIQKKFYDIIPHLTFGALSLIVILVSLKWALINESFAYWSSISSITENYKMFGDDLLKDNHISFWFRLHLMLNDLIAFSQSPYFGMPIVDVDFLRVFSLTSHSYLSSVLANYGTFGFGLILIWLLYVLIDLSIPQIVAFAIPAAFSLLMLEHPYCWFGLAMFMTIENEKNFAKT